MYNDFIWSPDYIFYKNECPKDKNFEVRFFIKNGEMGWGTRAFGTVGTEILNVYVFFWGGDCDFDWKYPAAS